MPDGTQTTSSPGETVDTVLPLRRRTEDNFSQLALSINGVRAALKALMASTPGDPALDDLLDQVARLTALHSEGADLFAQLAENPSAFRRNARAGLADVWELRRTWIALKEQFNVVIGESLDDIRKSSAERRRIMSETKTSPTAVPTMLPPVRDVVSTWVDFLCMTTRHFARNARTAGSSLGPTGVPYLFSAESSHSEHDYRAAAARVAGSPLFDTAFYVSQFPPDVMPSDPALHFVSAGWMAGRDPHPLFSTS